MARHLFVSVVVPTYNQAVLLSACIDSLRHQTYPREHFEVIIVDDGSTDETAERASEMARTWAGALTVLHTANRGPASARNAGLRASKGDIVAFIDSDCVADSGWLAALASMLASTDAAGVGGPILTALQDGWLPRYLNDAAFYRHRVRRGRVEYLLTANAAFRRAALLDVNGFSERPGVWGEDADLSFRLTQAGHHLLLSEAGSVVHYGVPTSLKAFAWQLYRYGLGTCVLSRQWRNGRTPFRELVRHVGAIVLSPLLAVRYAGRAHWWRAIQYWPLVAIEHAAFTTGIVRGIADEFKRDRWAVHRGVRIGPDACTQ